MSDTSQNKPDTTLAVIAWLIALVTSGYMIPWAIAATRGLSNTNSIGWINFLLGWTVIGWFWALIKSVGSKS